VLLEQGLWSPYLEVGIGPDAEIFTKAPILACAGPGEWIGVRRDSRWNNPEPELVLVVDSRNTIVGATLGNDVNLRDFEGRSALLLGEAKDFNGSCAVGPWLRLFDGAFDLDALMASDVELAIEGADGFEVRGRNRLAEISRDPRDLVGAAGGPTHAYPDGYALFLGTMYVPTADRDGPGAGFTHHVGDRVAISNEHIGTLVNRVGLADEIPRWSFGIRALHVNLAARSLLDRSRPGG
jgi:fumarylacetoacetate (FAA) hydrolase family protein